MPIVFFLASVFVAVATWFSVQNANKDSVIQATVEAQYVASNMINYQNQIIAYANYTDATGTLVNQARFTSATGDAAKFISACASAGAAPPVMQWFPGPRAGVTAQIVNQTIIVQYDPPDDRYPSKSGVQAQLLTMAGGTSITGQVVQ